MLKPNEVAWADFRYPNYDSEQLYDLWHQLHDLKKDTSGNPMRPRDSYTNESIRKFSLYLNDIFKERIGSEAP